MVKNCLLQSCIFISASHAGHKSQAIKAHPLVSSCKIHGARCVCKLLSETGKTWCEAEEEQEDCAC